MEDEIKRCGMLLENYRKNNMNFKNIIKKQKIGALVHNFKAKIKRNNTKKKPIITEDALDIKKPTKS